MTQVGGNSLFFFTLRGLFRFFLRWGCLRWLSIVGVFPTVDGGRRVLTLEKQAGGTALDALRSASVDESSST